MSPLAPIFKALCTCVRVSLSLGPHSPSAGSPPWRRWQKSPPSGSGRRCCPAGRPSWGRRPSTGPPCGQTSRGFEFPTWIQRVLVNPLVAETKRERECLSLGPWKQTDLPCAHFFFWRPLPLIFRAHLSLPLTKMSAILRATKIANIFCYILSAQNSAR